MLTLVLLSSLRPLIIDRPEEDIDNRMIYEELVPRIRSLKTERQLIMTTMNANLAVNGDAGMIIIMDSTGTNIRVRAAGSIDSPVIRRELCDLLEGTADAFEQRARKYRGGV